jgi:AcrR family transcriptional regulator
LPRRLGTETSKTRAILLDAAEQLMLEEGYPAVTSRQLAARAGLKPQLVHYYFRTMDDLFLALFRDRAAQGFARQASVMSSPQPLWALWELNRDPRGTALTMEFVALANHRKAIRSEIAVFAERYRAEQLAVLRAALARHQLDEAEYPPMVVTVLMTSVTRMLVIEEESLGLSSGHAETVAFVEQFLERLEGPRQDVGDGIASA